MLELPIDWPLLSTRFVVADLLRQADAVGYYIEAARAMVRSSLEFMLSGPRWTRRPERAALVSHQMGWRINDWLFYVLPRVDDDALVEVQGLQRFQLRVDLITPPWAAELVRHAVRAVLPHYPMDVSPIDSYIDLRILWLRFDLNMQYSECLMNVLERYSRLVQTTPAISIR